MNGKAIFGVLLVIAGIGLLMNGGKEIDPGMLFAYFWPSMFVIPAGLFFHWLYFGVTGRKGVGVLIPGGILVVAGIVCQIAMLFDGWHYMWPGFIFAVAVGLFEFYWFGGRNRYLLIPITVLCVLFVLFFTVFSIGTLFSVVGQPMIAGVLIVLGAIMLLARRKHDL